MSAALFGVELPQLTTEQPPQFTDAVSCRHWLGTVAGSNARQLQSLLLRQLNLLNRYPLAAAERYQILELLRSQMHAGYYECAVRFTLRPAPLAPPEQAAFDTQIGVWQALYVGYLHSLQEFIDTATSATPAVRQQVAAAASRAMACLQYVYIDHTLANRLPPVDYWLQLHRLYRLLEKLHLATMALEDPQRPQYTTSVASVYIETLLLAAAYPLEFHPIELAQTMYWARLWSARIPVLPAPPEDLRTPPLCLDLQADQAGLFKAKPQAASQLRWLDMASLRVTLKQMLAALERGEIPEHFRFRPDLSAEAGTRLLRALYQNWCRGGRRTTVKGGRGHYQLIAGIEAIHYYCSGAPFREPDALAHGIPSLALDEHSLTANYLLEDWRELGGNLAELLLKRPLAQEGRRLLRTQLLAVRSNDHEPLRLGKLHWVALDSPREHLLIGIQLLPGVPQAITLHMPPQDGAREQHSRGFLLPANAELQQAATLLIPLGWFQQQRPLQVLIDGQPRQLRLEQRLDSGTDFERCSYTAL